MATKWIVELFDDNDGIHSLVKTESKELADELYKHYAAIICEKEPHKYKRVTLIRVKQSKEHKTMSFTLRTTK